MRSERYKMKIRIAYHENKEVQQFKEVIDQLKPRIKTLKHEKKQKNPPYKVAFIILKNDDKTTR